MKNISLHNSGNQNYNCARLAPSRGAYHDRHDTWGAGCGGRFGVRRFLTPDENAKAYGEVVWSWRRGASCESAMVDGFASTTTDGGYGPRPSPGRRRSALRGMERLRNDALQTRDPGVWGCRDGSRLCGAPLKKRCTASGTREAGHDALWRLWAFPIPRKRIMVPDGSHPKVKLKSINIKGLRRACAFG